MFRHLCLRYLLIIIRTGFPGCIINLYKLAGACDPDGLRIIGFTSLTSNPLLPAILCNISATITNNSYGAITFTIRFRLVYFAVYASTLSLPIELQDSLHSGTSFPFYDGTFTHKIDAPYPGAHTVH